MNNKSNIKSIDALSLSLVLSFLLIHNIYIVLLGIILSVYSINKIHINKIIKVYNKKKKVKGKTQHNTSMDAIESDALLIINNEDKSLVDQIEELGYIPSLEKREEDEAA